MNGNRFYNTFLTNLHVVFHFAGIFAMKLFGQDAKHL